jgi:DNA polymerase phi
MGASPEEQQLAEKTSGILRQRIGGLKLFPETVDVDALKEDLEDLHNIARKASHQQVSSSTLSSSNVYLSKVLVHNKHLDTVVAIHRKSLADFLNRKGSKISHTFFTDFIKRIPASAWLLREDLIAACGNEHTIHQFRQAQAIAWTDILLHQILQVVRIRRTKDPLV